MVWIQIGFIAAGFLSGSVLYSRYLPWLLKRIDIVKVSEDHNPGTANVMKYAGVPMGICCLLCDMAKGFLPFILREHSAAVMRFCLPSLWPLRWQDTRILCFTGVKGVRR